MKVDHWSNQWFLVEVPRLLISLEIILASVIHSKCFILSNLIYVSKATAEQNTLFICPIFVKAASWPIWRIFVEAPSWFNIPLEIISLFTKTIILVLKSTFFF